MAQEQDTMAVFKGLILEQQQVGAACLNLARAKIMFLHAKLASGQIGVEGMTQFAFESDVQGMRCNPISFKYEEISPEVWFDDSKMELVSLAHTAPLIVFGKQIGEPCFHLTKFSDDKEDILRNLVRSFGVDAEQDNILDAILKKYHPFYTQKVPDESDMANLRAEIQAKTKYSQALLKDLCESMQGKDTGPPGYKFRVDGLLDFSSNFLKHTHEYRGSLAHEFESYLEGLGLFKSATLFALDKSLETSLGADIAEAMAGMSMESAAYAHADPDVEVLGDSGSE